MTNYVIEGDADFFAELTKDTAENEDTCLLTGHALERNHITLECGHKFNYKPLYLEARIQKRTYNANEIRRLYTNEIRCPYCRQITDKLLPYIPVIDGVTRLKGVNYPPALCMSHMKCGWKFKSGKHKGECCNADGFATDAGVLCERHWKCAMAKKKNDTADVPVTPEMEKAMKEHTVASLKELLKKKGLKVGGRKLDLVKRLFSAKT